MYRTHSVVSWEAAGNHTFPCTVTPPQRGVLNNGKRRKKTSNATITVQLWLVRPLLHHQEPHGHATALPLGAAWSYTSLLSSVLQQ